MSFLGFRGMNRARSPVFRYGSGVHVKTAPTTTAIIPPPRHIEPTYTMALLDGENAEITMYGEIVDAQPVDRRTCRRFVHHSDRIFERSGRDFRRKGPDDPHGQRWR